MNLSIYLVIQENTQDSKEMNIDIGSTTLDLTIESLKPNTLYKISFRIKWKKGCKNDKLDLGPLT